MKRLNFLFLLIISLMFVGCNKTLTVFGQSTAHERQIESHIASKLYEELHTEYPELSIKIIAKELGLLARNERMLVPQGEYERRLAQYLLNIDEKLAGNNLRLSEDFLRALRNQPGVDEHTPDLLYSKVLQCGDESGVVRGDDVIRVDLAELDMDGNILPHSKHEAVILKVNETVKGFALGVVGMVPNERRVIYIHPQLGYGKLGKNEPNQLLIYDVTLIALVTPQSTV